LAGFAGLFRGSAGREVDLLVAESGVLAAKEPADLAQGVTARSAQLSYPAPQHPSFCDEPVDLLL
jgi:hypothetical protein